MDSLRIRVIRSQAGLLVVLKVPECKNRRKVSLPLDQEITPIRFAGYRLSLGARSKRDSKRIRLLVKEIGIDDGRHFQLACWDPSLLLDMTGWRAVALAGFVPTNYEVFNFFEEEQLMQHMRRCKYRDS